MLLTQATIWRFVVGTLISPNVFGIPVLKFPLNSPERHDPATNLSTYISQRMKLRHKSPDFFVSNISTPSYNNKSGVNVFKLRSHSNILKQLLKSKNTVVLNDEDIRNLLRGNGNNMYFTYKPQPNQNVQDIATEDDFYIDNVRLKRGGRFPFRKGIIKGIKSDRIYLDLQTIPSTTPVPETVEEVDLVTINIMKTTTTSPDSSTRSEMSISSVEELGIDSDTSPTSSKESGKVSSEEMDMVSGSLEVEEMNIEYSSTTEVSPESIEIDGYESVDEMSASTTEIADVDEIPSAEESTNSDTSNDSPEYGYEVTTQTTESSMSSTSSNSVYLDLVESLDLFSEPEYQPVKAGRNPISGLKSEFDEMQMILNSAHRILNPSVMTTPPPLPNNTNSIVYVFVYMGLPQLPLASNISTHTLNHILADMSTTKLETLSTGSEISSTTVPDYVSQEETEAPKSEEYSIENELSSTTMNSMRLSNEVTESSSSEQVLEPKPSDSDSGDEEMRFSKRGRLFPVTSSRNHPKPNRFPIPLKLQKRKKKSRRNNLNTANKSRRSKMRTMDLNNDPTSSTTSRLDSVEGPETWTTQEPPVYLIVKGNKHRPFETGTSYLDTTEFDGENTSTSSEPPVWISVKRNKSIPNRKLNSSTTELPVWISVKNGHFISTSPKDLLTYYAQSEGTTPPTYYINIAGDDYSDIVDEVISTSTSSSNEGSPDHSSEIRVSEDAEDSPTNSQEVRIEMSTSSTELVYVEDWTERIGTSTTEPTNGSVEDSSMRSPDVSNEDEDDVPDTDPNLNTQSKSPKTLVKPSKKRVKVGRELVIERLEPDYIDDPYFFDYYQEYRLRGSFNDHCCG